jgi:hypothetical protein
MSYVTEGRCRSGQRWFWYAALWTRDWESQHCGDPVCEPGCGGHAYGWEDTEDLALKAMGEAVTQLGGEVRPGCYRNNAPGRAGFAAAALRKINAAKRKARPPSWTTDTGRVEYLYAATAWWPEGPYERVCKVIPFRITRKTPKRIYYVRSERRGEDPQIGYVDRLVLERDGEVHNRGVHWCKDDSHLYATRELAEASLYRHQADEAGTDLRQLRKAMADAHPDRGGTSAEFIAARERYKQALARSA